MLINIVLFFAGIYLTCTMAITTLSMVLTVLVLNLNSISERRVPPWMQIVVFRYLSPIFCKGRYVSSSDDADDVKQGSTGVLSTRGTAERLANYNRCNDFTSLMSISEVTSANTCTDVMPNGNCSPDESTNVCTQLATSETTTSFATSLTPLLRGDGKCAGRSVSWSESNNDVTAVHGDTHPQKLAVPSNSNRKSKPARLAALSPRKLERDVRAQRTMTSQLAAAAEPRERKEEEDYSKEWQKVAEVVDRVFFWVFLVAITIVSLLLFHPLAMEHVQPRSH